MLIKDIVNDFNTDFVSETILGLETECTHAEEYNELFKGVLLSNENNSFYNVVLNLECNEFARLAIFLFDEDGYIVCEKGLDDEGRVIYVNEL